MGLFDSLTGLLATFLGAGAAIAVVGTWLTRLADRVAAATGIGQALTGAVLLGATTSLGGVVTSVSTAHQGLTDLAISNAVGGIAVQTAFLAVADVIYRRANLEHAAASIENLLQGSLLIALLSLPLVAWAVPGLTAFGVSLFSPLMLLLYLFATRMVARVRDDPMWLPRRTRETQAETRGPEAGARGGAGLYLGFGLAALLSGLAGYLLGQSGGVLAAQTGLSQSAVGGVMTSVMTSVPELVTTIVAVRRGALTLAVGGIIGGNAFDVMFLVLSDVAYREGSIYAVMQPVHLLALAASILMSAILLMGLIARERQGPGRIGFESVLILATYAGTAYFLTTT